MYGLYFNPPGSQSEQDSANYLLQIAKRKENKLVDRPVIARHQQGLIDVTKVPSHLEPMRLLCTYPTQQLVLESWLMEQVQSQASLSM